MILNYFLAKICAKWTKVKRCFRRVLYHFTILGFKYAKINFLRKLSGLSAVVIELLLTIFQVITKPSSRLEKHQTYDFFHITAFL